MKYYLSVWHLGFESEEDPLWIMSEVDEHGDVLRQIERYATGEIELKAVQGEANRSLSDIPLDEGDFGDDHDEFSTFYVSDQEFERQWGICSRIVSETL